MSVAAASGKDQDRVPVVRFDGVSKRYTTGKINVVALQEMDLSIEEGSFVVVAGPSGSGKSTLLNLAGCVDWPTSGRVEVTGWDASTLGDRDLSRFRSEHLGFVFQNFNLIPVLSAYENVEYALRIGKRTGSEAMRNRTLQMLEAVDLADQRHQRPGELSGGQQQRVAIARALVTSPNLVLADEPTANLDSKTGKRIIDLMHEIQERENTTFVVATHDPMVAERACRRVQIHDGRIESDVDLRNGGETTA